MPKLAKQLTDKQIRDAKPGCRGSVKVSDTVWTLADGGGLLLRLTVGGTKSWQVRYRTADGKRGAVVIGDYPAMGLADARKRADEIHLAARAGTPIEGQRAEDRAKRETRSADEIAALAAAEDARAHSFAVVSEKWLEAMKPQWADSTYVKNRLAIRGYLQPAIGSVDVRVMDKASVKGVLGEMAVKVPSLARNARQCLSGFSTWCADEKIRKEEIPLKGVLPKLKRGHIPAATKTRDIEPLMRSIYAYEGFVVRSALLLCAWTAMRPGVVASARWTEIDLEHAEWIVPGMEEGETWELTGKPKNRMKMGKTFVLPLPKQAVAMLREMHGFSGGAEYVFPAVGKMKNPHLGRDALSRALRLMGYQGRHSTHGFRAMLRTVARERLGAAPDVLEAQLAHAKKGANGGAYDRAEFLDERREVMQRWADWLDELAGRE